MRIIKFSLAVLALAFIFAGCGDGSAETDVLGKVTIQLIFPSGSTGEGAIPTGVPRGATEADVVVKDSSGNTLATVVLTPDKPSQEVRVPVGVPLTFETSVKGEAYDPDKHEWIDVEIAWGEQSLTVQDGDVVTLKVKALINVVEVGLPPEVYIGGKATGLVVAYAPNGELVGPEDYTVGCSVIQGDATCQANESAIEVEVHSGNPGDEVQIEVTVTGLGPDHQERAFKDTAILTLRDPAELADIAVSKEVDNDTPKEGERVTFTITVSNVGPVDIRGVAVHDPLPEGLIYISSSATAGEYDPDTGVWSVGVLPARTSHTLTIIAELTSGTNGQIITNTATLDTANLDPGDNNAENNSASVSLAVGQTMGSVSMKGDMVAPDCGFINPEPREEVSVGENYTIMLFADDETDSSESLSVTVYLGATTLGQASFNGHFTLDWTPSAEYFGSQVLVAVVKDPNGNSSMCAVPVVIR